MELIYISCIFFILFFIYKEHFKIEKYDFYLAGPIRNKKNGNRELFIKTANQLRKRGFTVFNPIEENDKNMQFCDCMKKDLNTIINKCEAVFILPGWGNSLGCNAEIFTAYVCNKPVYQFGITTSADFKRVIIDNFVLPYNSSYNGFRTKNEITMKEKDVW